MVKVLHVGNVNNAAYLTVKNLRAVGVDAELVLDESDPEASDFPEWEEGPGSRPYWVRGLGERLGFRSVPEHVRWLPRLRRLRKVSKNYDLLHTWFTFVEFAPYLGKRYLHTVTGFEVSQALFLQKHQSAIRYFFEREERSVVWYAAATALGPFSRYLATKGLQRAEVILTNSLPIVRDLNAVGLGSKAETFSVHPVDLSKFEGANTDNRHVDFVIAHPTRHIWKLKGNHKVLHAVKLLTEESESRVRLITMDWGTDREKSKQLAKQLGIERHVTWMPKVEKWRLREILAGADVVIDQIGRGGYGTVAIEGAALGKPTIAYVPTYEGTEHHAVPFISCGTVSDLYVRLKWLRDNPKDAKLVGKRSRQWLESRQRRDLLRLKSIYESLA